MLGKFHDPQHMRASIRTLYNPICAPNAKTRKGIGCTVTVSAERVFRFRDRHAEALQIGCCPVRRLSSWHTAILFRDVDAVIVQPFNGIARNQFFLELGKAGPSLLSGKKDPSIPRLGIIIEHTGGISS